jgi:hypothetical protein
MQDVQHGLTLDWRQGAMMRSALLFIGDDASRATIQSAPNQAGRHTGGPALPLWHIGNQTCQDPSSFLLVSINIVSFFWMSMIR